MILALEASTSAGSVALVCSAQREVLWSHDFEVSQNRTLELPRVVAEMLRIPVASTSLTEILVGIGPGNYTGLRVAVSTAQGLSLALGVRVVAMPSWLGIERGEEERWLVGNAGRGKAFRLPLDATDAAAIELLEISEIIRWLSTQPSGSVVRLNTLQGVENLPERQPKALRLALTKLAQATVCECANAAPIEPIYLQSACAQPPSRKMLQ